MSFSYPAPFEFENGNAKTPASASAKTGPPKTTIGRSSTPVRRGIGAGTGTGTGTGTSRSKSNDELFFSAAAATKPRAGLGPKTKSGRHLPKPAPSLPIRTNATPNAIPNANHSSLRGRATPKARGIGQTQSSNLEQMQAARSRSSNLQQNPLRRLPSEAEDLSDSESQSPPHGKPSSLKAFLTSPMRKNKKVGENISVQSDHQKQSAFKQFLISPLRKPSNPRTMDMSSSVGMLDLDANIDADGHTETESSNARSKPGSRRTRRHAPKEEDMKSSRKDRSKPKTFQQLLGKSSTRGEDEIVDGKGKMGRDIDPSAARRQPLAREPSLSPEQQPQKPGSILTNLLDTLYDSYLDPKVEKEEEEEELDSCQRSVSRFDMSLSSLF